MLSNQPKLLDWQNLKRLALAMLFSVILHLLFLDSFDWRLIDLSASAHDDIRVELLPPPPEPALLIPEPEAVKPIPSAPRNPETIPKPSQSAISPDLSDNAGLPMPSDYPLIQMAKQTTADLSGEKAPEASGNSALAGDSQAPKETVIAEEGHKGLTTEQLNQLPTQVDMMFDVLYNGKIGEAEVHFRRSTDGHYQLTSERRATGMAAVFVKAKDIEKSAGVISSTGLNPSSFTHQFGKDGNKLHHAEFDWASAKLTLQENATISVADLPAGTQDMLSFMYQFMFVPPLTEMQVAITNGRKLNQYAYRFEGEEEIKTGLGNVKTLHIAKNSDVGDGKLDLWLGIDYHYLPMKIRKIDKNDKVYEQVISTLEAK